MLSLSNQILHHPRNPYDRISLGTVFAENHNRASQKNPIDEHNVNRWQTHPDDHHRVPKYKYKTKRNETPKKTNHQKSTHHIITTLNQVSIKLNEIK